MLVGCSEGNEPLGRRALPDPEPRVVRIGAVDLETLDPAKVVLTRQVEVMAADLLFDGLFSLDLDSGRAEPELIDTYSVSEDGTTWTFELRADAEFHDGSPVTSSDVKSSLERIAEPGARSLAGARLSVVSGYEDFVGEDADGIEGLRTEGSRTLVVRTDGAFHPLPELLAHPAFGVVPSELLAEDQEFFESPVGSGPLKISSASEDIIRLDAVHDAGLGLDSVELIRFDSVEASFSAFEAGELDWSLVPGPALSDAVEQYGDRAVSPLSTTLFYGINVGDPTLSDEDLRMAIVKAVDRNELVERFNEYTPAIGLDGLVPQGIPGHTADACGEYCEHDPRRAKELLEERYGDSEIPEVSLDYYEGEREQALAEMIDEDLEAVGIPTKLRPRSPEEYDRFVVSSEQELFLFGWVGVAAAPDDYLAPLFRTGAADNVTAFSDEDVDERLAVARGLSDPDERAEAYRAIERSILAKVPVIPVAQFASSAVISERLEGWATRLDGSLVLDELVIEK